MNYYRLSKDDSAPWRDKFPRLVQYFNGPFFVIFVKRKGNLYIHSFFKESCVMTSHVHVLLSLPNNF
jgi:hypothetical protein